MPSQPPRIARSATSVALTQAFVFKIVGLLAIVFVMAAYLLIYLAHDLDRTEANESEFYTIKAVKSLERAFSTTIKDYAFWGDAYKHLHLAVDVDWAYFHQNVGASLNTDFGVQGLFVVNEANRTVYAVINGRLVAEDVTQWLHQPITAILDKARASAEREAVTTAFLDAGGTPALVAAAALTPGTDPSVAVDDKSPSVLIFVALLDSTRLEAIGKDYGVKELRQANPHDPSTPFVLPLGEGGSAGVLQWTPPKPGLRLLQLGLPLTGIAALLVCLMTWVILRRATVAAQALDVTHATLLSSQAALTTSEARFRDVVEASSDWVWEIDGAGRFIYLSDRFAAVTGLDLETWIGACSDDLLRAERGSLSDSLNSQGRRTNSSIRCYYTDGSGHKRITRLSARALPGLGFRGTATDVTEEVKAQQRIEYLSRHDALTGLANRTLLREFLDIKLQALPNLKTPLALLTLDLDRFKPVNDLLGHLAGDQVLNEASSRLVACIRHGDLVARLGGDEFVLVVGDVSTQNDVEDLCQRLITSIERPIKIDDQDVFISVSIGIAMAPDDTLEALELLRYADIALYEAKASGRNTWRFYAGDMNARIIERRRLESDLRFAIKHGEMRLHFQPRYRIADGQMVGAEALVRWQHPERGLIPPDTFIPIAEDTGLILALSNWVLENACRQAVMWPSELFVSVNLSSSEFKRGNLAGRVQHAVQAAGIDPARVELEITETVMLEDADGALEAMHALKRLGVRIAMDDFGTGYSSLSYLRTFPFDGLKIDRSFVSRLQGDDTDKSVLKAIVGLGRALSLTVTAEGIETAEQLAMLKMMACEEGQGYFLSRPLDSDAFSALLGVVTT